jgi:hypothetical protein
MKLMRLRSLLLSFMIGAGLLLPVQTPALAKTNYKAGRKGKKGKKFKRKKSKAHKSNRRPANNVRR